MKKVLILMVAILGIASCEKKQLIVNDNNIKEILITDCLELVKVSIINDESKIKKVMKILNSGSMEPAKFICKNKLIVKYANDSSQVIIFNGNHFKIAGKTYFIQDLQELMGF